MHARALQAANRLPVRHAGRALHQEEGLALHRAHHIVAHGRVDGYAMRRAIVICMPLRVGVPGNNVQLLTKLEVIQALIEAHQVRRDGDVRIHGVDSCDFVLHEVDRLVRREALPVERQAMHVGIGVVERRVNLIPLRVGVAPEVCPVLVVQLVQRTVLLLQEFTEG